MNFLISMVTAVVFILLAGKNLKKHSAPYYIGAAVISLAVAIITIYGVKLPTFTTAYIMPLFAKGGLAGALFVIIASANAFPSGSKPIKTLMPIRGELSIIACILAMSHMVIYGRTNFVALFTRFESLTVPTIVADIMSIGLAAIMLPLFITSFKAIRKKINPKTWKKLQCSAYLFYALIFGHIIFFTGRYAIMGRKGYRLNLIVYSMVFLSYAVCRILKALSKKKSAVSLFKKQIAGLIASAAVVTVTAVAMFTGFPGNTLKQDKNGISENNGITKIEMSEKSRNAKNVMSEKSGNVENETDHGVTEATENRTYNDGTYTGSALGNSGDITVQISIKDDIITSIEILNQYEDEPYFTDACAVIEKILSENSTDVDTVSGATNSSGGIIDAVAAALKSAMK